MEPSALKLVMVKGPRAGETLEFGPRSKIRLGRVVRGNNLPIKDDGISSKHLVIESESGKWVLRDLGSSNGTIVNGTKVSPEIPLELCDGDEIKIGEYTAITVKIDGYEESRLRRNPRRGAAAAETSAAPIAQSRGRRGKTAKESKEQGELEKPKGDEIEVVAKHRRGRPPKGRVLKSEVEPPPMEENSVRPVSTRRTRSSKNEELGKNREDSCVGGEGLKIEPRRTRGSSRRKNVPEEPPVCDNVDIVAHRVVADSDGVKLEPKSTCPSSRRKNVPEEPLVCDKVDIVEHRVVADSEGVKLEPKNTFGSSKWKNVQEELPVSVCDKVDMPVQRDMGDHIMIDAEDDQAWKGLNFDQEIDEEARSGDKDGNGNASCSGVKESVDEDANGDGSGSGAKKSGDKDGSAGASSSGVKEGVDLEKMTMGQWFDFLEVYLVKQITNETEGAIAEMIEKAKRAQEYIAQQKKRENMSLG